MKKIYSLILLTAFIISAKAQTWGDVSTGMHGNTPQVRAMATYNSELYAGGFFDSAGTVSSHFLAKWNGTTWSGVGTGILGVASSSFNGNGVYAMAQYGSDLYIAGGMHATDGNPSNCIVKWNGSSISAVGTGIINNGVVYALAVYAGELYVGGEFDSAGGVFAKNIAKWNGISWSAVGSGTNNIVRSLAAYSGNLYVGGTFTTAGGISAGHIAKWNGSAWSTAGSGMDDEVYALTVQGTNLYAGGAFSNAGGVSATKIARWNGTAWSALGTGIAPYTLVNCIASAGSNLYVGGGFTTATFGAPGNNVTKWNGSAWSAMGSGTNAAVYSMGIYGPDLYIGGIFNIAGGTTRTAIARWTNVVGIEENEFEMAMNVYPNPSSDKITIDFKSELKNSNAVVFNIAGEGIWNKKFSGNTFVIEKEALTPGIYFVRILSESKEVLGTKKIVVQ